MPSNICKTIAVTGGGSGIGAAVARLLAQDGHQVIVGDLANGSGPDTVSEICALGGNAVFQQCDVTNESEVAGLVDLAREKFGGLHGACNAAGIGPQGKAVHQISVDEWDRCFAVNLRGIFLCNKYQAAAMLESGGSIVNIASTNAMVGIAGGGEYCASKAGILGLVRSAALDYALKGIRVNAVLPGATATPMMEKALQFDRAGIEAAIKGQPMQRMGTPDEIACAVRWLLSDEASFVTGSALIVDGALTAA